MNQVTTKVLDNNRGSKLVPALGEAAYFSRTTSATVCCKKQSMAAWPFILLDLMQK